MKRILPGSISLRHWGQIMARGGVSCLRSSSFGRCLLRDSMRLSSPSSRSSRFLWDSSVIDRTQDSHSTTPTVRQPHPGENATGFRSNSACSLAQHHRSSVGDGRKKRRRARHNHFPLSTSATVGVNASHCSVIFAVCGWSGSVMCSLPK